MYKIFQTYKKKPCNNHYSTLNLELWQNNILKIINCNTKIFLKQTWVVELLLQNNLTFLIFDNISTAINRINILRYYKIISGIFLLNFFFSRRENIFEVV